MSASAVHIVADMWGYRKLSDYPGIAGRVQRVPVVLEVAVH
jgi:hypothetical protein